MNQERILSVLNAPHVSEKSTVGAESGRYVFKVASTATKPEIKRAIEQLFEVKVEKVQVVNMKGKVKRFGQKLGRRGDWKKAYITLESGQELDFMGAE